MKRPFFKTGLALEVCTLISHLYYNRNGLPIPVIDPASRQLTHLMDTYKIKYSAGTHTLRETLWGYDLTWAALTFFAILTACQVFRVRTGTLKTGRYIALTSTILWFICAVTAFLFWSPPQQILFSLLLACFTLSYFLEWNPPKPNNTRICIVGAGISGLTAAYQLQKQGYKRITVLEKASQVGGKCASLLINGHPIDLGGHEMLAGYTDIMDIADELMAQSRPSIPPLVYDRQKRTYLNFKQAATLSKKYTLWQVIMASLKYLFLVGITFRTFSKPSTGYKNVPQELTVPLEDWLTKRGLLPLTDILSFVVRIQGYGHFTDTSAAYLVKFMGVRNWFSLLVSGMGLTKKWPRVFVDGMLNVCHRMAATIQDVRLETAIDRIERSPGEEPVRVYINGEAQPLVFDKLIIATPLELSDVSFLDKKPEEQQLFTQVRHFPFYTTVCRVEGLPAGVVGTIPLNDINHGEYTGYIRDYTDLPVASFFSLATEEMTGETVNKEIARVLEKVPEYDGQKPRVTNMIHQQRWRYFPHVTPAIFSDGFYDQFEELQGKNNTYYASSLLSFECVGNSVSYTKRLIMSTF